jgi:hypothetical protein
MQYVVNTQSTDLQVRSGPSLSYPVVGRLARGTVVDIVATQGDWGKLTLGRWVSTAYLRPAAAAPVPTAASPGPALQLVAREGAFLIFNRVAQRREVADYIWGPGFDPTPNELYSRSDQTRRANDLDFGDTHWALAQTAFAARPDLYRRMRAGVRQQIEGLADRAAAGPPPRPDWVPQEVWVRFLAAGDGVHRYQGASRYRTDIILIRRQGRVQGGYAEAPTDPAAIGQLMRVAPPSTLRRLLGAETPQQASVRWLAEANAGYNRFLKLEVQRGVGPRQALQNYRNTVHQQWLAAFLPLIGLMGAGGSGVDGRAYWQ